MASSNSRAMDGNGKGMEGTGKDTSAAKERLQQPYDTLTEESTDEQAHRGAEGTEGTDVEDEADDEKLERQYRLDFKNSHAELVGEEQIWTAYNTGTLTVASDADAFVVGEAFSAFGSLCGNRGPPKKVLLSATREMQRGEGKTCDSTQSWRMWEMAETDAPESSVRNLVSYKEIAALGAKLAVPMDWTTLGRNDERHERGRHERH